MSKIDKVADRFLRIIEAKEKPSNLLGRKTRKQLSKDLSSSKDVYSKVRSSLAAKQKAYDDLGTQIESENKILERAKKDVSSCYDVLKNMDLVDCNEVKFMPDDEVCYVQKQRLYRLVKDKDSGHLVLEPYKKKYLNEEEDLESKESEEDTEEASEESDDEPEDFLKLLMKYED